MPFLATGFGIAVVIITGDEKLLLVRRHDNLGARAGKLDVSVVEGIYLSLTVHQPITVPICIERLLEAHRKNLEYR